VVVLVVVAPDLEQIALALRQLKEILVGRLAMATLAAAPAGMFLVAVEAQERLVIQMVL
jgi:hypothetical protein